MGISPAALSSRECSDARSVCVRALAGLAQFAGAGSLAGRGIVGTPPCAGRISRLDHRIKKHAIRCVLPSIDPVFHKISKGKRPRQTGRREVALCI